MFLLYVLLSESNYWWWAYFVDVQGGTAEKTLTNISIFLLENPRGPSKILKLWEKEGERDVFGTSIKSDWGTGKRNRYQSNVKVDTAKNRQGLSKSGTKALARSSNSSIQLFLQFSLPTANNSPLPNVPLRGGVIDSASLSQLKSYLKGWTLLMGGSCWTVGLVATTRTVSR